MRTSGYLSPRSSIRSSNCVNPSYIRNDNILTASYVPSGLTTSHMPSIRRIDQPMRSLWQAPAHFNSNIHAENKFSRSRNYGGTHLKSSGVLRGSYVPSNGHITSSRLVSGYAPSNGHVTSSRLVSGYVPSNRSYVNGSTVRSRAVPSKMN